MEVAGITDGRPPLQPGREEGRLPLHKERSG
jgi:hypothetical protein